MREIKKPREKIKGIKEINKSLKKIKESKK